MNEYENNSINPAPVTDGNNINPMPVPAYPQNELVFTPVQNARVLKTSYPLKITVLSVICILCSYLFIRMVIPSVFGREMQLGTMMTLINFAFCIITAVYFRKSGVVFRPKHFFLLVEILAFNLVFVISSAGFIEFLCECFLAFLIAYWCYTTAYNTELFSDDFMCDGARALFRIPFGKFPACTSALLYPLKKNKFASTFKYIILGLLCTIPVSAVVAILLMRSDEGFKNFCGGIFDNLLGNTFTEFFRIVMAILIGSYLFGMIFGNMSKSIQQSPYNYACLRTVQPLALSAFVTPVCVLYAMYFAVQGNYFLSGFNGKLPESFTYSEYARQGFFELLAIAMINLGLIILIQAISKREEKLPAKSIRFFTILLSSFTLLIIATAISKMVMYIGEYGLSQLRVYTSWFMLLLAILFILIIIRQFIGKFRFYKAAFVSFTVMFAVLCFGDIDGRIAEYNVNAYLNGTLETLDVNMLYDLSDSSARYVLPVADSTKNTRTDATADRIKADAFEYLKVKYDKITTQDFLIISVSSYLAGEEMKAAGIQERVSVTDNQSSHSAE